jgi:S-DNA-T family DNA segregation ATPase FtsK/SpoIIIE
MNKRFSYLETKGYKSIDPKRDKLDNIIVAVDEASELYSDKLKSDPDYELSAEVQALTNSIARLGRAAGIHLILATQKMNKESINTIIQENISARMCFKMNTLQGSLQVLGHKGATELSNNPGRGIWQMGNEEYEVQVPFLAGDDVKYICGTVSHDFETGQKKLFQPMIGKADSSGGNENKNNAIKNNLVDMDV